MEDWVRNRGAGRGKCVRALFDARVLAYWRLAALDLMQRGKIRRVDGVRGVMIGLGMGWMGREDGLG